MSEIKIIHKVLQSTLLIGFFSLVSRLLGVFRDHLLATKFGALNGIGIYDLDPYFAAFRIPDFIFSLLVYGTVSSAFVPVFREYLEKKGINESFKFANSFLNIIMAIILVVVVIMFITAPYLLKIIVPGFQGDKLAITLDLTRIMLISPIIFTFISVFQSIQNVFHKFFYYSLAPVFYNIGIILGIIFFSQKYGVYGVAFGVVLGSIMHLLIQVLPVFKLGYRYQFVLDWKNSAVRETLVLVIPRIFGMSAFQLSLFFDAFIASLLPTGSLTILNYAINLNSLPVGILGVSLSVAAFSLFSDLATKSDWPNFNLELKKALNTIFFFIIPASFGFFVLKEEIVSLILRGGKFQHEDVILTSNLLGIFTFGLLAQSLIPVVAKAFYACKNTKTPTLISFCSVFANIILSLLLVFGFKMGLIGLAISNVSANLLNIVLLLYFMRKNLKMPILNWNRIFLITIFSIIMFFIVYYSKIFFIRYFGVPTSFISYLIEIVALSSIGAIFYLGIFKLWKRSN